MACCHTILVIFLLFEQTYDIYIYYSWSTLLLSSWLPLGRGPPLGCLAEIRTRGASQQTDTLLPRCTLYRSTFIDDDILHWLLWVLSFYGSQSIPVLPQQIPPSQHFLPFNVCQRIAHNASSYFFINFLRRLTFAKASSVPCLYCSFIGRLYFYLVDSNSGHK